MCFADAAAREAQKTELYHMLAFARPVAVGMKDPWMDLMQDLSKHAY